jgi:hypothetical protein
MRDFILKFKRDVSVQSVTDGLGQWFFDRFSGIKYLWIKDFVELL